MFVKCFFNSETNHQVMKSVRSNNNYYLLKNSSNHSKIDKKDLLKLWHDILGHIKQQALMKIIGLCVVPGLPNLTNAPSQVCSNCAKGKQTMFGQNICQLMLACNYFILT